jgi:hypothetical protein
MAARAEVLHRKAVGQVDTLIELVSDFDDGDLRRPCPGREKLGDGSIGTLIAHTADNYLRIAALLADTGQAIESAPSRPAGRHIPRFGHLLGGLRRHRPRDHGHGDLPAAGGGDVGELRRRLSTARADLARIGELDDLRLDSIPPEGSFRFCDGKRSLDEVLAALLTHQEHQVEILARA